MGLSSVMNILNQYRNASAVTPPPQVEEDYSQVAQNAPQTHLASGLAEAFRSEQTPSFGQMLSTLFSHSDGQQRAGILNQLLSAAGPGLLASGAFSSLAGILGGGHTTVTPEQANQLSPNDVQQLAEHAEKQNPSIIDQASQFYAQHPTLVKALGAGSLALIMSHLSRR
jgi:hypothetical protein